MAFQHSDAVKVKRARGKGRGVFARRKIHKDEIIERVPMILMSTEEYAKGPAHSILKDYCFCWGTDQVALALGYGSLYNHSDKPNARYEDAGPSTQAFVAIRAIDEGEEITINDNGSPRSRAKVSIPVVEAKSPGAKALDGPVEPGS